MPSQNRFLKTSNPLNFNNSNKKIQSKNKNKNSNVINNNNNNNNNNVIYQCNNQDKIISLDKNYIIQQNYSEEE